MSSGSNRGGAIVLALISPKGGSGKTTLSLGLASILQRSGVNTLLVDCDLATHGATYFFEPEFVDASRLLSLSQLLSRGSEIREGSEQPLVVRSGFGFLPSVLNVADREAASKITTNLQSALSRLKEESDCDCIILDCQAGYTDLVAEAVRLADRTVVVLEADSISHAALRVLVLHLGSEVRNSRVWQITNKVRTEEYAIERSRMGSVFRSLPPVPFDWNVRAAFATGEVPEVLPWRDAPASGSSVGRWAVGIALLRMLRLLLPQFEERLQVLEENTVGSWMDRLSEKLNELEAVKSQARTLVKEAESTQREARSFRTAILSAISVLLAVGATLVGLEAFTDISRALEYSAFGAVCVAALLALNLQGILSTVDRASSAQRKGQRVAANIEEDLEPYVTLLQTDPRFEEYASMFGAKHSPASRESSPAEANPVEADKASDRQGPDEVEGGGKN